VKALFFVIAFPVVAFLLAYMVGYLYALDPLRVYNTGIRHGREHEKPSEVLKRRKARPYPVW